MPKVCFIQAFPQLEQLQQQFCDKVQAQSLDYFSKDGSVRNVVPDPDVPHGCDANSVEYEFSLPPFLSSCINNVGVELNLASALTYYFHSVIYMMLDILGLTWYLELYLNWDLEREMRHCLGYCLTCHFEDQVLSGLGLFHQGFQYRMERWDTL